MERDVQFVVSLPLTSGAPIAATRACTFVFFAVGLVQIGLADPQALVQAVAAWDATKNIGMPEADCCLAQAAVYMARAPKSTAVYFAYDKGRWGTRVAETARYLK